MPRTLLAETGLLLKLRLRIGGNVTANWGWANFRGPLPAVYDTNSACRLPSRFRAVAGWEHLASIWSIRAVAQCRGTADCSFSPATFALSGRRSALPGVHGISRYRGPVGRSRRFQSFLQFKASNASMNIQAFH